MESLTEIAKWIGRFPLAFPLFFGYLAIAFLVHEEHPFSRFPMYSSFPAQTNFYYLADENNKPVAGMSEFKFSVTQLKDAVSVRVKEYGLPNQNVATIQTVGDEVLNYIVEKYKGSERLLKYQELKLVKRDITVNNDKMTRTDSVVSVWRQSKAY